MSEAEIKHVIGEIYKDAEVRAVESSVGWLLEVIDDTKNKIGPLKFTSNLLVQLSSKLTQTHFWKVFSYGNIQGRYLNNGTLHTIEKQWENNMETVVLSGQDSYLDLPEFDSELLSLGDYSGHEIPCLQSIGHSGAPILPYHESVTYLWLETLGGCYSLASTRIDKKTTPPVVWLKLKG